MEAALRYIVSSLVEHPDQVEIKVTGSDDNAILEMRVAPSDIGKVIGKNGRVARSLRTIIQAAGNKEGKQYTLEILD